MQQEQFRNAQAIPLGGSAIFWDLRANPSHGDLTVNYHSQESRESGPGQDEEEEAIRRIEGMMPGRLALEKYADDHRPPQSWYEEEFDCFEVGDAEVEG